MAYQAPLNGGRINASIGGNSTSAGGGYQLVSTGTMHLMGGNNVTLGQNANSISINAGGGGTMSMYALGNTTQNSSATMDVRSVSLNGLGGLTAGYSNGSVQLSAPVVSSVSATGALSISANGNTVSMGVPAVSMGMSNIGNTSGTSGTASNQLIFAGGNNVTLSQSTGAGGNTLTISAANQTNQNLSLYALGNTTQNSSTLLNASNLSFNGLGAATVGYSNGSIQVSAPVQTNQTANFYVSSNSTQLSSTAGIDLRSVSFQGAGIASVGVSQGKVLISVPGGGAGGVALANSQTTFTSGTVNLLEGGGAVTIASSAGGQSFKISVPTVSSLSATGAVSISNNAGTISIGAPSFSGGMSNLGNTSGSTGTVTNGLYFAGGNNITLSQSTNGVSAATITVSAAAQTNQTANFYVSSNSTQLSSTAGIDLRSVSFQGAGNVSIGVSQGKVLVSGGGGGGGVALYDGANSISSGTARVSAGGGLTASINGQTLSLSAPAQSSLSATGIFSISANGSTISMGAPAYSAGISTNGNTSGTTGFATNQLLLAGGNNITLSQSTGAGGNTLTISAAAQTNQSLGLYGVGNTTGQSSSSTFDARTLSFQGAGAASVGYSNGSMVISAPNAAAGNVTFSAGGNSAGLASLVFSNSNGVSFGLNGSTITASAAGGAGGGVNIAASNTTFTSGTVVMSNNGGALTISSGNQSVLFSVPASSSLIATGGLSASTNGTNISLGVPGLMSNWLHNSAAFYSSTTGNMINGTASVARMLIPAHISFTRVDIPVSISVTTAANANTAGMAISAVGVIYSRNGSTLNPIVGQSSTSSYSYASSTGVYSSITGPRVVSFNMATTLSAGEYYFGFQLSSAASSMGTATTNPGWAVAPVYGTSYSAAPWSDISAAPSQTVHLLQPLQGINSVMVTNTTMTMQQSQISQSGGTSGGLRGNFIVNFRNN